MKKITKNKHTFFVSETDSPVERDFWKSVGENRWENETYEVFDFFINKNSSYIDIGSWIGPTVLYGCQLAKHCYAIEPDPVAFKSLKNNVELNPKIKNKITLFNGCIGDTCGKVQFGTRTSFGDSSSSLLFTETGTVDVESLTLEAFIERNNIKDCNFIKIDIEGGEVIVLPKIKKYLQENMPTLLLSLHPFFFRNEKNGFADIMNALKIYPHIYYTDGQVVNLDRLMRHVASMDQEKSFSIIAVNKWGYFGRMKYILIYKMHKLINKTKHLLRLTA